MKIEKDKKISIANIDSRIGKKKKKNIISKRNRVEKFSFATSNKCLNFKSTG